MIKKISKQSSKGVSCQKIRDTVMTIKTFFKNIEIATVYNNNLNDIISIVEWGLENNLQIKVLEKTNQGIYFNPIDYEKLIIFIKKKFKLKLGITADLQEYYLTNSVTKIKFFQSHCDRKECDICKRLHMRVTCNGLAKPCIIRNDAVFNLLSDDFNKNMNMAIANLGIGPKKNMGLHGNLWVNQREIHQNPSSVKRQSGITAPVGRFYSVCRLTAART